MMTRFLMALMLCVLATVLCVGCGEGVDPDDPANWGRHRRALEHDEATQREKEWIMMGDLEAQSARYKHRKLLQEKGELDRSSIEAELDALWPHPMDELRRKQDEELRQWEAMTPEEQREKQRKARVERGEEAPTADDIREVE